MFLNVSEYFYSIQGEGMSMGRPSFFLRLRACNLLCGGEGTDKDGQLHDGATWRCDTIEVWLKGEKLPIAFIVNEFLKCPVTTRLIITGGEPLLQQRNLIQLIEQLPGRLVEIETNGTIMPDPYLWNRVQWNVSPKLRNSGMPESKRIVVKVLERLKELPTAQFKFVVSSAKDLTETLLIVNLFKIPREKIWLMPAADNLELLIQVQEQVVEMAKDQGFNYSNRLHIQVWNRKTGV